MTRVEYISHVLHADVPWIKHNDEAYAVLLDREDSKDATKLTGTTLLPCLIYDARRA